MQLLHQRRIMATLIRLVADLWLVREANVVVQLLGSGGGDAFRGVTQAQGRGTRPPGSTQHPGIARPLGNEEEEEEEEEPESTEIPHPGIDRSILYQRALAYAIKERDRLSQVRRKRKKLLSGDETALLRHVRYIALDLAAQGNFDLGVGLDVMLNSDNASFILDYLRTLPRPHDIAPIASSRKRRRHEHGEGIGDTGNPLKRPTGEEGRVLAIRPAERRVQVLSAAQVTMDSFQRSNKPSVIEVYRHDARYRSLDRGTNKGSQLSTSVDYVFLATLSLIRNLALLHLVGAHGAVHESNLLVLHDESDVGFNLGLVVKFDRLTCAVDQAWIDKWLTANLPQLDLQVPPASLDGFLIAFLIEVGDHISAPDMPIALLTPSSLLKLTGIHTKEDFTGLALLRMLQRLDAAQAILIILQWCSPLEESLRPLLVQLRDFLNRLAGQITDVDSPMKRLWMKLVMKPTLEGLLPESLAGYIQRLRGMAPALAK